MRILSKKEMKVVSGGQYGGSYGSYSSYGSGGSSSTGTPSRPAPVCVEWAPDYSNMIVSGGHAWPSSKCVKWQ